MRGITAELDKHKVETPRGGTCHPQPVKASSGCQLAICFPSALDSRKKQVRLHPIGLGYAFASASRFRKAASPASDTSTHFGLGEASES